jgi:hypothetical protein
VVSGGAGSGQVVHDLGRHTGQRIRHEPVDVTNRHHLSANRGKRSTDPNGHRLSGCFRSTTRQGPITMP